MKSILIISLLTIFFCSCKKQTDSFSSVPLSAYYPLSIGKYVSYNLDSTIFINFGQSSSIVHYQAQDRVEDTLHDNLGRLAYRVVRYIKNPSSQNWSANNTFMVIPSETTIEVLEDNLRYQKLKLPVNAGFSWKGNSYIDSYSLNSDLKYLDDWDYTYDSVNVPLTLGSIKIDSTVKVSERDETLGQDPNLPSTQFAERNFSVEKYGKNIGLIYKEFLHWEYQGPQPGRPGYYAGYGIKLTMTDHN